MKFAWGTQLLDLSERCVADENGNTITLGYLAIQALTATTKEALDGAQKFRRYCVAAAISKDNDLDVTDAALVKETVGLVLATLPMGRIWDLLEHPIT